MSRYINDVRLDQPIDVVSVLLEDFIYHNRFSRTDWNGEMVYWLKDSHGTERYMKWFYADGVFHVEAWLKGPFGREMDLDGLGGGAGRREFREALDGLIGRLKRQDAGALAGGHAGSDPLHHDGAHGSNHDVWRTDTAWQQGRDAERGRNMSGSPVPASGNGIPGSPVPNSGSRRQPTSDSGLILAVLALMFGWSFSVLGIILGALALKRSAESAHPGLVRALAILAFIFAAAQIGMVFWLSFLW